MSSAVSGLLGSLGAYGWGKVMGAVGLKQFSQNAYGMIGFGALSGGIGTELTGGNFWHGAIIGGVVAGLNHVLHRVVEKSVLSQERRDLTKEFDRTIKETKDFFVARRKYYENKIKSLVESGASQEAIMAVPQEQLQEFYDLVKTNGVYDLKSNENYIFSKT